MLHDALGQLGEGGSKFEVKLLTVPGGPLLELTTADSATANNASGATKIEAAGSRVEPSSRSQALSVARTNGPGGPRRARAVALAAGALVMAQSNRTGGGGASPGMITTVSVGGSAEVGRG